MVGLNSRLDDVQWIGDDGGDGGGDGGGEESRAKGDDVGGRRGRVRVERWVGAAEDADGRGHEESFGTGRVWGRDAEARGGGSVRGASSVCSFVSSTNVEQGKRG